MTTASIRKKVHEYVDEADSNVLDVVYKLLEVYHENKKSYLSAEQKSMVEETAVLYKAGKIKGYSMNEFKKRVGNTLKK